MRSKRADPIVSITLNPTHGTGTIELQNGVSLPISELGVKPQQVGVEVNIYRDQGNDDPRFVGTMTGLGGVGAVFDPLVGALAGGVVMASTFVDVDIDPLPGSDAGAHEQTTNPDKPSLPSYLQSDGRDWQQNGNGSYVTRTNGSEVTVSESEKDRSITVTELRDSGVPGDPPISVSVTIDKEGNVVDNQVDSPEPAAAKPAAAKPAKEEAPVAHNVSDGSQGDGASSDFSASDGDPNGGYSSPF